MGKYFKIGNAWKEVKSSRGILGTSLAVGKLVGKSLSNTVVYTVTEAVPQALDQQEKKMKKTLNRNDLTQEQREKIETALEKREEFKTTHQETLERWKRERENR